MWITEPLNLSCGKIAKFGNSSQIGCKRKNLSNFKEVGEQPGFQAEIYYLCCIMAQDCQTDLYKILKNRSLS